MKLITNGQTDGGTILIDGHTSCRTHLELVEVEVMVCDRMGWFTRWGYQYWMKRAQQHTRLMSLLVGKKIIGYHRIDHPNIRPTD